MNVNEAIQVAKEECKDGYAQTYLRAIPKAIELGGDIKDCTAVESFKTQLRYALGNMQYWRGENARQAKAAIRQWVKEN